MKVACYQVNINESETFEPKDCWFFEPKDCRLERKFLTWLQADDLGPQLHSKRGCKSSDRLIHFVKCSNVHNSDRDSNTAQSNFLWSSGKVSNGISAKLHHFCKRMGMSCSCSDISSGKAKLRHVIEPRDRARGAQSCETLRMRVQLCSVDFHTSCAFAMQQKTQRTKLTL